jgi:hypothetical protein
MRDDWFETYWQQFTVVAMGEKIAVSNINGLQKYQCPEATKILNQWIDVLELCQKARKLLR